LIAWHDAVTTEALTCAGVGVGEAKRAGPVVDTASVALGAVPVPVADNAVPDVMVVPAPLSPMHTYVKASRSVH